MGHGIGRVPVIARRHGDEGRRRRTALCLVALLLIVLAGAALGVAGCGASESDLTATLLTTQDNAERLRAAARLATMHSVAATQRLADAAQIDPTAKLGLEALRDEYAQLLAGTISKAQTSAKSMSSDQLTVVGAAVDCLATIGDEKSLETLGDMVLAVERPLAISTWQSSQTTTVELRALAALARASSPAALEQIVQMASLGGTAESIIQVRGEAITALKARPEAAQSLFEARVKAGRDTEVTDALDGALVTLGEPAVAPLIADLGTEDWVEDLLVQIGSPAAEPLAPLLGSTVEDTRDLALELLLKISAAGNPKATAVLTDQALLSQLIDARETAGFDDEADSELQKVIANIGKPAIEPLMAAITKYDWAPTVLAQIGADAVPALTAALNSKDRDTRFAAADALVLMQSESPESVQDFTQALEDSNIKYIAKNYAYYIRLGKDGTETTLVKALNKYGNVTMAEDYLNCGNTALETGAQAWADKHGYSVTTMPGSHGGPIWGEGN